MGEESKGRPAIAGPEERPKQGDALEAARALEPQNFFAQFKYAELHYRLRALVKAEAETLRAVDLSTNAFEMSLARKQLQEIRRLHPREHRSRNGRSL